MTRLPGKLHACRACAAPIVFARLETGKVIPLDPLPDPDRGNVACRLVAGRLTGFVITRDRLPGPLDSWRALPHFATCEARQKKKTPTETPAVDVPLW